MPAMRIGVIGTGFGARVHIPAYQMEGLDVVAVCARRPGSARDAAERFGIPHAFADHREMLAMDGLDAVAVVVPQAGERPSEDALLDACGALARFKRPEQVVFVEALPRNALGKVLKRELRESLAG